MDFPFQQSITDAVSSAIATAVTAIQAKHENKILSSQEIIKRSLLLKKFSSVIPTPDPNATPKALSGSDSLTKTSTERWNQADLGYFDPHFDRVYGEGEIVSVGKDGYYMNVVLFVLCLQSLVTFQWANFVKANIAISLQGSVLKCYTSKLSDFDRNALNNNPGVESWVNTLSLYYRISMSVAFSLLTDKIYFLQNARARQPLAQYVHAIMRHGIGCNIVDITNHLCFAFQGLAPKLRVFVSLPTKSTKETDFICAIEKEQEVGHEMMTTTTRCVDFYPIDPLYQVSPRLSLVTNFSIKGPCHSSLGGPPSETLIASPPRLLHFNKI